MLILSHEGLANTATLCDYVLNVMLVWHYLAHLHVHVVLAQQYRMATTNKRKKEGFPWWRRTQQQQWFRVTQRRCERDQWPRVGVRYSFQTAPTFFKVSQWQQWWHNTICSSSVWASATEEKHDSHDFKAGLLMRASWVQLFRIWRSAGIYVHREFWKKICKSYRSKTAVLNKFMKK